VAAFSVVVLVLGCLVSTLLLVVLAAVFLSGLLSL
jgi:hypothetical protein